MTTATDHAQLKAHMAGLFEWKFSRTSQYRYYDLLPWWRDPDVLAGVGPLLAEPFRASGATVVIGPSASGYLSGGLAAVHLSVGFCPIRKDPSQLFDEDAWVTSTSPPDYLDRHVVFGIRKGLIKSGDKVLAVDDVVDTGGQLFALQSLVHQVEATWLGASVLVDALHEHQTRRKLNLRAVFHERDL